MPVDVKRARFVSIGIIFILRAHAVDFAGNGWNIDLFFIFTRKFAIYRRVFVDFLFALQDFRCEREILLIIMTI